MAFSPMVTSTPMLEHLNLEFVDALRSFLNSERCSDLTIVCGERRWPVHRALLCSKSRYFQGALNHSFREAQTGVIDFSDYDSEAVEYLIDYFYHNDYLVAPGSEQFPSRSRSTSTSTSISTSSSSYNPSSGESSRPTSAMSDYSASSFSTQASSSGRRKFNLSMVEDPLLAMAADNLPKVSESPYMTRFGPTSPLAAPDSFLFQAKEQSILPPKIDTYVDEELLGDCFHGESEVPDQEPILESAHLVTHAKVFAIAEQFDIKPLKELARKKYLTQLAYHRDSPQFAQSFAEVYATIESDRGLRDVVINAFRQFPELAQRSDIEAMVKETPALAWELFRMAWGMPM